MLQNVAVNFGFELYLTLLAFDVDGGTANLSLAFRAVGYF